MNVQFFAVAYFMTKLHAYFQALLWRRLLSFSSLIGLLSPVPQFLKLQSMWFLWACYTCYLFLEYLSTNTFFNPSFISIEFCLFLHSESLLVKFIGPLHLY